MFRITVKIFGKPADWALSAIEHWTKRIRNYANIEIISLRNEKSFSAGSNEELVCLTRTGKQLTSREWAEFLEKLKLEGKNPVFLIGPADGIPPKILAACGQGISFGPSTLQHDVALIVLLEQIYRALTINAGTPYHRGK